MSSRSPAETGYRAPEGPASAELRDKGSRFLAELVPAASEAEAREALADIERRRTGATHHCWAWRLGWPARERSADAGEPSGTAGAPILRALQGAGVSDALVVVTRWYGGVKLGRGGLVRAYGGAAAECLAAASLVERRETAGYVLTIPYDRSGPAERLLAAPGLAVVRRAFGERVEMVLDVAVAASVSFVQAVAVIGRGVELFLIKLLRFPLL